VGAVWATRLRWRLRGAWLAPAFAVLVIAEAVLLHELPIAGDGAPSLVGGALLATFFNLVAVAVLAPLGGWLLRRRRPDLPTVVARDYAGTAALLGVAAILVVLGLSHRDEAARDRAALEAGLVRVRDYVRRNAPEEFRRHIHEASSMRFGDDLYRTCVPGDDPDRALCLFISTDQDPPGLRVDPSRAPNTIFLPSGQRG
jgi:hypothetical protein